MELDKLLVKIQADLTDLKRGMNQANQVVDKSSSRMRNSFKQLGKDLSNLGTATLKYGSVLAGVFGGLAIKRVIGVGMQIENLQVQLKNLFNSAEEGAKAFDIMAEFAAKVPFELEEIQKGAGLLAAVSTEADDLTELLKITGNVASVTGLDFAKTAEQIQRSFSSGIASADLFREKAVKSLLGFSADARANADETAAKFREVFGTGGRLGKATDEFALTLTGTISMLQDKLFFFNKAIADGFFESFKGRLNNLNNQLATNMDGIKQFGKEIGENLTSAMNFVIKHSDEFIFALKAIGVALLAISTIPIVRFFTSLNGILTLLVTVLISFKKEIIEIKDEIGFFFDRLADPKGFNNLLNQTKETIQAHFDHGKAIKILRKIYEEEFARIYGTVEKAKDEIKATLKKIENIFNELGEIARDMGDDFADAFGDAVVKGESFRDAFKNIMRDVSAEIVSTITRILIIEPLIDMLTEKLTKLRTALENIVNPPKQGFSLDNALNLAMATVTGGFGGSSPNPSTGPFALAHGGFTKPNTPYLVGERGPELFVPNQSGRVVSNSNMGGGVVVNQSINFSTGIVPTVRAEVMNLMPEIKKQTVGAVSEARSRGGNFAKTFGA